MTTTQDALFTLGRKGRNLLVTVGGELEYEFAPVNVRRGRELAAAMFGIQVTAFAAMDAGVDPETLPDVEGSATQLVDLVFGEQYARIEDELSDGEATQLLWIVFLWQALGGSYQLAEQAAVDQGKAIAEWQAAVSLSLSMTSTPGSPGDAPPTATGAGTTPPNSSPRSPAASTTSPKPSPPRRR